MFVDHGATVKVVVCHGKSIVVVLLELVGCTDSHACALASYYRDGFPRRGGCGSELRRDRGNLSVEPANIIYFVGSNETCYFRFLPVGFCDDGFVGTYKRLPRGNGLSFVIDKESVAAAQNTSILFISGKLEYGFCSLLCAYRKTTQQDENRDEVFFDVYHHYVCLF